MPNYYDENEQDQNENRSSPDVSDTIRNYGKLYNQRNQNSNDNNNNSDVNQNQGISSDSKSDKSNSSPSTNNGPAGAPGASGTSSGGTATGGAATGEVAAGGAAAGGSATGGAAAGGAAAGGAAAGGAAAGAAAGSVVPIAGTAIGAAVGAVTGGAAKKGSKAAGDMSGVAAPVGAHAKSEVSEQNTFTKIVLSIFVVIFALVLIVCVIIYSVLSKVASPVFMLWEQLYTGYSESIEGLNSDSSYEEIVAMFNNKLMTACEQAYKDTCYKEVYQIAVEQEYDLELTLESYNQTKFPYIMTGDKCNINYAEILNVISMSSDYVGIDYTKFNFSNFCTLLEDDEFKRCLYDLDVIRREINILNDGVLGEGETGSVDENGTVTITSSDGTVTTITGEAAKSYYTTKIYGEVHVDHYPLKKLYDYFKVDPYAVSPIIPSMTNHQSLGHLEYFSRHYYPNSYWGNEKRTELLDYKKLTGELNTEVMNIYEKDINDYSVFSDTEVFMDVQVFKQGGNYWSGEPYGQSRQSIAKIGCCLTSMAMVCNYFSDEYIDPHVLNTYITETNKGLLSRPSVARHYGFKQYNSSPDINIEEMMGELQNGRLLIIHLKAGAKGTGVNGHWVVLNGYVCNDTEAYFYVSEPARRLNNTVSMSEAVMIFDQYQSYGK